MVQLVKPDPADSNFQFRRGGRMLTPSLDGLPLTKPPHGRVTALDLNDGTLAWTSPVGEGPPPERASSTSSIPTPGRTCGPSNRRCRARWPRP
ncbi:MAG: PQQ-binding-like beta-propeller repeat protein [Acidobacteria bacterium]|nr:PQQ-binding-like beta-propeller repeat protein [Acidobacteriota bacterium]